jgi:hypothetical protein
MTATVAPDLARAETDRIGCREHGRRPLGERGYAMLMVMLMATLLLVTAMGIALDIKNEGQRGREEELAWRGNQYVRAIRIYYKKNNRLPKSLEDLTKYTTDQPRYIRKAYKDPFDTQDKGWRLIYLGPGGTLVGSLMHKTLYGGGFPGAPQQGQPGAGTLGSTINPPSGTQQQPGTIVPPGPPGNTPQSGQTDPNQPSQGTGTTTGPMFGGQVIGVASTVKKLSVRVCDGGVTYEQWEFIWDPTKPGQGNQPCTPANLFAMPGNGQGANPGQKPPAAPGWTRHRTEPTAKSPAEPTAKSAAAELAKSGFNPFISCSLEPASSDGAGCAGLGLRWSDFGFP